MDGCSSEREVEPWALNLCADHAEARGLRSPAPFQTGEAGDDYGDYGGDDYGMERGAADFGMEAQRDYEAQQAAFAIQRAQMTAWELDNEHEAELNQLCG